MKKTLIAVAAFVLLYPAMAWLMGLVIQQRIEHLAYQSQSTAPQLHLLQKTRRGIMTSDVDSTYEVGSALKVTRHYHRGWYSSVDEASVEMSIAALGALPGVGADAAAAADGPAHLPLHFSLRTVIHHGPFCGWTCVAVAGADTHLTLAPPVQAKLTQLFGSQEPVAIHSRFGFFGGSSTRISTPGFDRAQIGQDAHLKWGGLTSTVEVGPGLDWYDVKATVPSLRLEEEKGAFEIDGMSLDLHGKRVLRTLYGGDSRMELKHVAVENQDKAGGFSVDDLTFASQQQAQNHFMNVSYKLGTSAVRTQPLALTSAHFDFTWKHLGIESLESLTAAMQSARQDQSAPVAPAARAQNMMAALKRPVGALLLDQPEMDIDRISLATAQGQGLVTGVIHLVDVDAADIDVPMQLLRKLDVRLDFEIDEAFLSSLPGAGANASTQMQPMVDQGYITRSNGKLRTQLLFRGGQPTLNGKPFNPGAVRPAAPAPSARASS